jgi:penicillin-binding protein 1A
VGSERGRTGGRRAGSVRRDEIDEREEALDALLALRAQRRRRGKKPRGRLALVLGLVAIFLVALAVGSFFTGAAVLASNCNLNSLRPISLGSNSFVFASDGTRLGVVPSTRNRQPLRLGQMSAWLPKATIAIEDRRFYQHGGVDYRGIARAAYADLLQGRIVQGGSTITQQLVRNLYIGSQRRTLGRKLKEACLAIKLGNRLPKNTILADYLNEVSYGNHASGIEAAAQTYFSRPARRLTLVQAALLAGLPQAPSLYDPFANPSDAKQRRDEVLRAMAAVGEISPARLAAAVRRPLGLVPGRLYTEIRQPNFFGYVEQQLVSHFGEREVQSGGLQIQTTLDPHLQVLALQAVQDVLREPQDPAAAVVAIDPATGAIKAMISYRPDHRKLQFNLATQGHRQAGSAFKPFVLTAAIQQGISIQSGFAGPPEMLITDPRCEYNGQPWDVHNYADESGGYMNLADATAHSVNTIFAQLVTKVGPDHVVAVAHGLGIASHLEPVCSITLGSQAVTPLEMTDAYATFAANGIHHPAQALKFVRDPSGRVLARLVTHGNRVISPNTAATVNYALQGVVDHGTGTAAYFGRPAAGKTGTAESYQDAWFCGFVPQLATCVWLGYPRAEIPLLNVEGYAAVFGGSLPAQIWHDFMAPATASLPVATFPVPTFGGVAITGPTYGVTYGTTTTTTTTTSTTTTTPPAPTTPAPSPPAATPAPPASAPSPAPTPAPTPPPPAPTPAAPAPAPTPETPPPATAHNLPTD